MSFTTVRRNFAVKVVAALVAVAMAFVGLMVVSAKDAAAAPDANRDRLRPGCVWDPYNWWVQYCKVYSPSMQREIPVQIRAAVGGGNASLYMLDGLYGFNPGASGWIWSGHVAQTFNHDNITLVAPAAGDGSFYADWYRPAQTPEGPKIQKWETFLTRELPVYLQREFGVSPNRNAIAGLSMGAAAAMSLAARHRDQFKHVTSLSGYYQTSNPIVATGTTAMVASTGVANPFDMWGVPFPASPERLAHDPSLLLNQLQGLPMYISSAQGVSSLWSDPSVLNRPVPELPDTVWRSVMESVSRASTQMFEQDARRAGLNAQFVYSPNGIHSWELWGRDAALARPHILRALGV
ncbi:alpha/beta hydrolase family protein [uncultured Corynebacterium sp.]|uniref:alpha/beta hydrolase n=1 Tax=uncultured Corynebacterium sp. TaxID=159447 RepID=UPI002617137C|nr:alpha/beta hydrolase family protein [uncultured Corynebacterium sp.]